MGIQVVAGANSCNGMGLKFRIIEYDPAYLFTFHFSLFTAHCSLPHLFFHLWKENHILDRFRIGHDHG